MDTTTTSLRADRTRPCRQHRPPERFHYRRPCQGRENVRYMLLYCLGTATRFEITKRLAVGHLCHETKNVVRNSCHVCMHPPCQNTRLFTAVPFSICEILWPRCGADFEVGFSDDAARFENAPTARCDSVNIGQSPHYTGTAP